MHRPFSLANFWLTFFRAWLTCAVCTRSFAGGVVRSFTCSLEGGRLLDGACV
jgi:hypothetical protein